VKQYLTCTPSEPVPEGVYLVHNFYPGPPEDPGRDRELGLDGFRAFVCDAAELPAAAWRCDCGWLGLEHYGTVRYVDKDGELRKHMRDETRAELRHAIEQADAGWPEGADRTLERLNAYLQSLLASGDREEYAELLHWWSAYKTVRAFEEAEGEDEE
jgi:hypothetical protein